MLDLFREKKDHGLNRIDIISIVEILIEKRELKWAFFGILYFYGLKKCFNLLSI